MKLYRIYFSPTGGTKKAAVFLSRGWEMEAADVDLMGKEEEWKNLLISKEDVCIIAVPSFGGRVPGLALERIRSINGNGARAVLLAVYGNREIDDTLLELREEAKKQGFLPAAAVSAVAEHSIIRTFAAGRPDEDDEKELEAFGKKIKEKLEQTKDEEEKEELNVPGNYPYREYKGVPMKPEGGKGCKKCGVCAAECPVHAIPADRPSSVDRDRCISCMRCIAVCPGHSRRNSGILLLAAEQKMKKSCAGRKENKLYL